jgi:hypothetical protein
LPANRIVRRLTDLSDFSPVDARDGQVLRYTSSKWQAEDATYVHTQNQAATVWEITHNLKTFPSVTVVDSAGSVVIGNVTYASENRVTLSFSAAFGGKAYLN